MLSLIIVGNGIELIYFSGFMLACFGAMILGKWSIRNLILFMFWIAVVISLMKAAIYLDQKFESNQQKPTYTVKIPV